MKRIRFILYWVPSISSSVISESRETPQNIHERIFIVNAKLKWSWCFLHPTRMTILLRHSISYLYLYILFIFNVLVIALLCATLSKFKKMWYLSIMLMCNSLIGWTLLASLFMFDSVFSFYYYSWIKRIYNIIYRSKLSLLMVGSKYIYAHKICN